ncbi:MAG: DUF262 domain-containing protein, partial [Deltaproteobacteria bacterium]|nr:DUF262 domain-containing protein [Deltaproteobacteria bacterium]
MNNKKPAKTGNDSTEKNDSIISQFIELRREVDYYTCDCAIDFLAARFRNGEFFISAEYQRNFVWDKTRKCRFIESILLGYPIPIMFFSDNDDGRCDIVDGAQRTSALEEFLGSDLVLTDLKKLTELNGLIFEQLPLPIQRKFNKTTLRIISLEEGTSLEVRQEIFNRINTPALNLTKTSAPGGTYQGKFMDFMTKCSDKPLF